ncbi:hypothetical protein [Deinococcus yunweiensis]|uniref:hypothetical protein n=1 Tax=Deinococcus yunweiensis TaxID=367282 RepID=UPI00398F8CCE
MTYPHEVPRVSHPHRPRTISAQQRLAAQAAAALARPSAKSVRLARQQVAALAWEARLAGDWTTYRIVMRHLKELRSRTKAGKWKPTSAGQDSARAFRSASPAQRRRALDQLEPDSSALLAISDTQERWKKPDPGVPQPITLRAILYGPEPGAGTVDEPEALKPRYASRRAKALTRHAVHELARVLYRAHSSGWGSLNLTSTYGRPSGSPRPLSTGGLRFSATAMLDGVVIGIDTLITTSSYQRALDRLTPVEQSEIRSYYRRNSASGDTCPDLEDSTYLRSYHAFDRLLHALYDQGSLK